MGTSILGQVAEPLRKATQNAGINVVNSCKGGDFLVDFKNMGILTSHNEKDSFILHFLGNNIFNKKRFKFKNVFFSFEHPGFLNDKDVKSLISNIVTIISKVRLHFKGKVKLIGTFQKWKIFKKTLRRLSKLSLYERVKLKEKLRRKRSKKTRRIYEVIKNEIQEFDSPILNIQCSFFMYKKKLCS